jgi:hypothetical protein
MPFLTNTQNLQEGIEISRSKEDCKSTAASSSHASKKRCKLPSTDLVIHPRFMHFMHMLWLVGRIDHILRSLVRCWQYNASQQASKRTSLPSATTGTASIEECKQFLQDQASSISAMGVVFAYAVQHILKSLERLL